jgi:hypothetical protein
VTGADFQCRPDIVFFESALHAPRGLGGESPRGILGAVPPKHLEMLVIPTGIEPVTYRLGICRSILLSYGTTRPDT